MRHGSGGRVLTCLDGGGRVLTCRGGGRFWVLGSGLGGGNSSRNLYKH